MDKFEIYNYFCVLKGLVPCRFESLKSFAFEYPELVKKAV